MPDRHPNTHSCPKAGCGIRVARERLACRSHWFALPKELRDEINYAYRHRGADDGDRHRAAMIRAIEVLNAA